MAELSRSIKQFILSLFLISCWHVGIDSKDVIVETNLGKIRGLTRSFLGEEGRNHDVLMFLGVPYAQPPVNQLRFKPPQPTTAWKGVLDARQYGNICPQTTVYIKYLSPSIKRVWPDFTDDNVSEDCLYLNIFVPEDSTEQPFPVLFYIHGGTYMIGTPVRDKTPGHVIPALHGIILVTIQYRLGALGFLTTGDSVLPGNSGMLDQVAALTWVNENIGDFGGDPNRITIAGNSAGGSSVSLHLLSPLTTGLFQRAIIESGVEFSPFAILPLDKAIEKTKTVAKKLLCDTSNSRQIVQCLQTKNTFDILFYYEQFPGPVIDKYYLPDTPENLRKKAKAKNVSVIMGFTKHEGSHMISPLDLPKTLNADYFRKGIERTIQVHLEIDNSLYAMRLADALEFQYNPWHKMGDNKALENALVKLSTDFFIIAPTFKAANFHSEIAPTYVFHYGHLSKEAPTQKWVSHSSNVDYGFGAPLANLTSHKFNEEDRNISLFIMKCYSNFVKYGDPTPDAIDGVNWTEYNVKNGAFLDVKAQPEMAYKFHPSRIAFWNFYVPKLLQDRCTIPPRSNATTQPGQGNTCCCSHLVLTFSLINYFLTLVVQ